MYIYIWRGRKPAQRCGWPIQAISVFEHVTCFLGSWSAVSRALLGYEFARECCPFLDAWEGTQLRTVLVGFTTRV